jgi:predicted Zn-dependent peptidase
MRRLFFLPLLLSLCTAPLPAANAPTPEQQPALEKVGTAEARFGLKFDPVKFIPPHVDHAQLPNGITLDFYPDAGLPLVSVMVRIGNGSLYDPAGKVGVAEATAQVIRNGGTVKHPGDELDRALESRGAALDVSADREEVWFRLSVLREDLEWGLEVMSDLLTSPALPANKLDEFRGPRMVELQQRLDVPMQVASALFPQLVYGKGSPWGWTATANTLQAITVDDLRACFKQFYRTGNMKLGMSGGIDFASAQRLASATLGQLPRQEFTAPTLADPIAPASTTVYMVPRDATQNVIYFGHLGISRLAPEKFPVRVFNNVLAGGFTSRLFQEVRSNRGLAYSVFGRIGEGTRQGVFFNAAMTKAPSTAEALKLMLGINRNLQTEIPTADEMDVATQSDVNAFVFFFDRGDKIVQQQITLDVYGYPKDYLATYVDKLKGVTPKDVQQAAHDLLHLDKLAVLIVGKPTPELTEELKKLGPIHEISDSELRKSWL